MLFQAVGELYMNTKKFVLVVSVMAVGVSGSTVALQESVSVQKVKPTLSSLTQSGKTNLKIRFVEGFDTMRQCEQGVECGKSLERTRDNLSKAIQDDEQRITQCMTEFQSKAPALSAVARENEEKKLRKMKTEYDTKLQESEYEMKLAMQKITEELSQEMDKAVVEVAKRDQIDAVVDTATGRVLYVKSELNITQAVVAQMNTENQIKVAKNKAPKSDTVVASAPAPKTSAAAV